MANRRIGGIGGNRPGGGGRSFLQQQPFQGNVNPWQGGMSNNLNQGLLSQLSNPQQLAIALSSLLQPQQQQQINPPSLLSLNASPFNNQDRDFGRFGNRGRSDFRRHEPYNKNRGNISGGGGWRTDSRGSNNQGNNRNNRGSGGGRDFKKRSPQRTEKKTADVKKKDEAKKEKDESNDLIDDSKEEEGSETKRDWKAEKNTSDEKVEGESAENGEKKETDDNKDGKYFDVPQHLLHCFVCAKDMWDGESFQKHVRGRAHKQMLDSLEESFQITVNILRENMRLTEEKKMIELNRMQRLNKNRKQFDKFESHCNMCDFKFMGKIMSHRKSEGHQRLKRFLHPNCEVCSKEFPSRMDWVDHRLTPEHLRELTKDLDKETKSKVDGAKLEQSVEFDLEVIMDEATETEGENPILELTEDLTNLQNRMPAYRKTRAIGSKSLSAFTGWVCTMCNKSFAEEKVAQDHLKSPKHYYKFIEVVKMKYQKQDEEEKNKKNKEKAEKEAASGTPKTEKMDTTQDSEMYDPEEAGEEEEEEEDAQKGEEDEEKEVKTENADKTEEDLDLSSLHTEVEIKEDPSSAENTPTRPKRGGAVKNGAGPKSKKVRK